MGVYGFNEDKSKVDIEALIATKTSGKAYITKWTEKQIQMNGGFSSWEINNIPTNALMIMVGTNEGTGDITSAIFRRSDMTADVSSHMLSSVNYNSILNKLAVTRVNVAITNSMITVQPLYLDASNGSSTGMPRNMFDFRLFVIRPENA